jgi:hypothetical protein
VLRQEPSTAVCSPRTTTHRRRQAQRSGPFVAVARWWADGLWEWNCARRAASVGIICQQCRRWRCWRGGHGRAGKRRRAGHRGPAPVQVIQLCTTRTRPWASSTQGGRKKDGQASGGGGRGGRWTAGGGGTLARAHNFLSRSLSHPAASIQRSSPRSCTACGIPCTQRSRLSGTGSLPSTPGVSCGPRARTGELALPRPPQARKWEPPARARPGRLGRFQQRSAGAHRPHPSHPKLCQPAVPTAGAVPCAGLGPCVSQRRCAVWSWPWVARSWPGLALPCLTWRACPATTPHRSPLGRIVDSNSSTCAPPRPPVRLMRRAALQRAPSVLPALPSAPRSAPACFDRPGRLRHAAAHLVPPVYPANGIR